MSNDDPRFTAEISTKMRVPDKIMVGENQSTRSPTFVGVNGPPGMNYGRDFHQNFDMKVPDRILVAGGEQHIAAKSTPFEMQVEDRILPPTRDHVRVNTPPRSIKLNDLPNTRSENDDNDDDEEDDAIYLQPISERISRPSSQNTPKREFGKAMPRSSSVESGSFAYGRPSSDPSLSMMETIHGGNSHNMNPWEEIQLVRRQIAKLNHRLMAVELENQQQQQREMILTALVTCYFIGKFFVWLNRSP